MENLGQVRVDAQVALRLHKSGMIAYINSIYVWK